MREAELTLDRADVDKVALDLRARAFMSSAEALFQSIRMQPQRRGATRPSRSKPRQRPIWIRSMCR